MDQRKFTLKSSETYLSRGANLVSTCDIVPSELKILSINAYVIVSYLTENNALLLHLVDS
jgi:hypothetical protein